MWGCTPRYFRRQNASLVWSAIFHFDELGSMNGVIYRHFTQHHLLLLRICLPPNLFGAKTRRRYKTSTASTAFRCFTWLVSATSNAVVTHKHPSSSYSTDSTNTWCAPMAPPTTPPKQRPSSKITDKTTKSLAAGRQSFNARTLSQDASSLRLLLLAHLHQIATSVSGQYSSSYSPFEQLDWDSSGPATSRL